MPSSMIICRCIERTSEECIEEREFRADDYKTLMLNISESGWRVRYINRYRTEYICPKCGRENDTPSAHD